MKQFPVAAALSALARPRAFFFGTPPGPSAPARSIRVTAPPSRLLGRDRLRLGLGAEHIAVALYCGRRRSQPACSDVVPFAACSDGGWRAAVEALPHAVARFDGRRLAVTVIVADRFVRYALLPWSVALGSEAEWLALARHRFSSVHGGAADGWQVRVARAARESPRLACAIDAELMSALHNNFAGRAVLVSVQPHLMAVYNRLPAGLRRGSFWLLVEEGPRMTVALLKEGAWYAVRSRHRPDAGRTGLAPLLDRESSLLGLVEPCYDVRICTEDAPLAEETAGAYRLRDVTFEARNARADRKLSIALE
ncbi:MAG TPA: hypothetical protein VFZ14_13470 [Burkholderiales bacterium]|nr:hypothetical protein [Burkholderiales bacterium]